MEKPHAVVTGAPEPVSSFRRRACPGLDPGPESTVAAAFSYVPGAPNRRVVPGDGTLPSVRRGGGYR